MDKVFPVKLILAFLLVICCILQLMTSLEKFLSVKTTLSHYKRNQPSAPMPTVVLCSSRLYKLALMEASNMTVFKPEMQRFEKWPTVESAVREAWANTTFSAKELMKGVFAKVNGALCFFNFTSDSCKCWNRTNNAELDGKCWIQVKPLDTMYNGRCYVFTLAYNVTTVENMYFVFQHHEVMKIL